MTRQADCKKHGRIQVQYCYNCLEEARQETAKKIFDEIFYVMDSRWSSMMNDEDGWAKEERPIARSEINALKVRFRKIKKKHLGGEDE